MGGEKTIRVGSRKSELALIQTKHVIARLQKNFPHKKFEIHTMSTIGDRVLNISLPKIGEKSLFTRDLEEALRTGGVDFIVHSLKDLPTSLPTGMAIGAVLQREDARDALVLRKELQGCTIATLPKGSVIGTSSLRRTAQIRRRYPHLQVCDIRGNLNTRLAKLDAVDSKFSGIVLAQAGLERMGWTQRINQVLEPVELLYAVGQGALAVECRSHDQEVLNMLRSLMCLPTSCRILAERSFLKTLGGGCSAPVAVCSTLAAAEQSNDLQHLTLTGAVWSLDGITQIRAELSEALTAEQQQKAQDEQLDEPAAKRARNESANGSRQTSSSPESTTSNKSPTVIDEDANLEQFTQNYDMQQLLEKHMDLAKQCPVLGASDAIPKLDKQAHYDRQAAGDAGSDLQHCPLPLPVGQDFMGACPFVAEDIKVAAAACGKCPVSSAAAGTIESSKCPFSAATAKAKLEQQAAGDASTVLHAKCPFLQQAAAVQMFDYGDEDKPLPSNRCHNITGLSEIECAALDNSLFCGLFAHACYKRDLFARSQRLGQQLAEELIKKGALEVMKVVQNEIHSKIQ